MVSKRGVRTEERKNCGWLAARGFKKEAEILMAKAL